MTRFILWLKSLIGYHQTKLELIQAFTETHEVYDPSMDDERILKGEVESYFD